MSKECEASVIVPTYNERENLPILISLIIKHMHACEISFEVLVIDDHSPDGTAEVFESVQKVYPDESLILIERPGKMGLGSAYRDGLRKASGRLIFLMDADLSHHPKYFKDLLEVQRRFDCDIVSGTRYRLGGGVCGWNFRRILMSCGANFLAQFLLSPEASDLTSSFRLYRREVLKDLMPAMRSSGYAFQMEVVIRAGRKGYSIRETPIVFVDRMFGVSKLGIGEVLQYLRNLMWLAFVEEEDELVPR